MTPYSLAPEWERQDAVIVVWPHVNSDWSNNMVAIEHTYSQLCKVICKHQAIIIVAYDEIHKTHIKTILEPQMSLTKVIFTIIKTNDTWVRDYGPIVVSSGNQKRILNFSFDAWGKKYAYDKDNAFNEHLIKQLNTSIAYENIDFVLEAGNIEINSKGELLSSLTCFKRNSKSNYLNQAKIEEQLYSYFDIKHINWIDIVPLVGDDTDGHIDTLVRYCSDETIVYSSTNDKNNSNFASLNLLEKQLKVLNKNNLLNIIPLELPTTNKLAKKPASYANFLITNKAVLVPVFCSDEDDSALKLFDEIFPNHEIIDIESSTLITQLGGIHCATMQLPVGILN